MGSYAARDVLVGCRGVEEVEMRQVAIASGSYREVCAAQLVALHVE